MRAGQRRTTGRETDRGRIAARPRPLEPGRGEVRPLEPGAHRLGLDEDRDGLLYVPAGYRPDTPSPLVLALHGAGGDAEHGLAPLLPFADDYGLVLLAVESRDDTWDLLLGGYGPDAAFVERALDLVFERVAVDERRVATSGFSDGASYALSLGLSNGELFTHVIAFSPGFSAPARLEGTPRLFVSHGTRDVVLRIEPCSRRIVPQLAREGYDVRFEEFDGGHTVPRSIAHDAVRWMLDEP